ncbi:MAG: PIN domain-containing protein [Candidatus Helarchaeota archaeon]|nr:PIN domain-containing protein [Candidatus Helarchaeota archaeon]
MIKLVIDANILFAALIKKSTTADLLITGDFKLYAPEFLLIEFQKYEALILKKTHRSQKEFNQFLTLLKRKIKIIPRKKITPFLEKAKKISPDPKDIVYLALALAIDAKIWSNDKRLKEKQQKIAVLTTIEILKLVNRNT